MKELEKENKKIKEEYEKIKNENIKINDEIKVLKIDNIKLLEVNKKFNEILKGKLKNLEIENLNEGIENIKIEVI